MLQLKHRSASGRLDSGWEYDPARHAVDVYFRTGTVERAFSIRVCHALHPRLWAHQIVRKGGDCWAILPIAFVNDATVQAGEMFQRTCRPRHGAAVTDCPVHAVIGCGEQIVLLAAPPPIVLELEELER